MESEGNGSRQRRVEYKFLAYIHPHLQKRKHSRLFRELDETDDVVDNNNNNKDTKVKGQSSIPLQSSSSVLDKPKPAMTPTKDHARKQTIAIGEPTPSTAQGPARPDKRRRCHTKKQTTALPPVDTNAQSDVCVLQKNVEEKSLQINQLEDKISSQKEQINGLINQQDEKDLLLQKSKKTVSSQESEISKLKHEQDHLKEELQQIKLLFQETKEAMCFFENENRRLRSELPLKNVHISDLAKKLSLQTSIYQKDLAELTNKNTQLVADKVGSDKLMEVNDTSLGEIEQLKDNAQLDYKEAGSNHEISTLNSLGAGEAFGHQDEQMLQEKRPSADEAQCVRSKRNKEDHNETMTGLRRMDDEFYKAIGTINHGLAVIYEDMKKSLQDHQT